MNRSIVKFLSIFIFNKQQRKEFRKRHIKIPEHTRKILELQESLKRLEYRHAHIEEITEDIHNQLKLLNQTNQKTENIQNQLYNLKDELYSQTKQDSEKIKSQLYNLETALQEQGAILINPKNISPARGLERVIQLLALEVLKDIDRVCRKHNIRYWLDYGTLLGAVRQDGFIPWDDDLDISMPWEDYIRFKELDISEFECAFPHFQTGLWGKVYHKDFFDPWPNSSSVFAIFVDIFPYNYLDDSWSMDDAKAYILELAKEKTNRINELEHTHDNYVSLYATLQPEFAPKEEKLISYNPSNYLFLSLLWPWQYSPRIIRTTDVFPLREITFENYKFMGPAHPEIWLTSLYGAWWQTKIFPRHMNFNTKKIEEIEKLCNYAKQMGQI